MRYLLRYGVAFSGIATKKWGLLTFGGTGFPFGVTINDKLCRLSIKNTKDGCEYNVVPLQAYGSSPLATYGLLNALLITD